MTKEKILKIGRKKNALALTLLLLFTAVSCGKDSGDSSPSPIESSETASQDVKVESDDSVNGTTGTKDEATSNSYETSTKAISATSTVPSLALNFKTNVSYMNLTTAQKNKYNQAVALVKKVVATEGFKNKILNYTYAGKKQFADNKGRTNAQIYQSILDAAESLKPAKNNTMDVGVKMYYQNNSVVGWTTTSISYINVNTKFFNSYAINQVSANLFHEWLHKLGYTHDSAPTSKRPYSVPYAVGYMIRDLGKSFL